MRYTRPKIGGIVEIPLNHNRRGYAQYVFLDKQQGPLIRVFDVVTEMPVNINDLQGVKQMFPPVITGLFAAVRTGLWKKVGNLPINDFIYPLFVSGPLTEDDKLIGRSWGLWDGNRYVKLGKTLPDEYKDLERPVVWAPQDVAKRIESKIDDTV